VSLCLEVAENIALKVHLIPGSLHWEGIALLTLHFSCLGSRNRPPADVNGWWRKIKPSLLPSRLHWWPRGFERTRLCCSLSKPADCFLVLSMV